MYIMTLEPNVCSTPEMQNFENNVTTFITFRSPCISMFYDKTATTTPHPLQRRLLAGQGQPASLLGHYFSTLDPHWDHLESFKN